MNHKWPLSWISEVYYSFHPKAHVSLRNCHAGEVRKKKVLITNAMLNAHHFANSQDYFFFAVGWTVCCHWLWVFLYFLLCWQEQIPELACILVFLGISLQTKQTYYYNRLKSYYIKPKLEMDTDSLTDITSNALPDVWPTLTLYLNESS